MDKFNVRNFVLIIIPRLRKNSSKKNRQIFFYDLRQTKTRKLPRLCERKIGKLNKDHLSVQIIILSTSNFYVYKISFFVFFF